MKKPMDFEKVLARILRVTDILFHRLVLGHPPTSDDPTTLEARDPDELEDELIDFALSLPPGFLYLLLAVHAVARGNYEPNELLDAYEAASNHFPTQREAAYELMEDAPMLAGRLRYGFQRLARAGVSNLFTRVCNPNPNSKPAGDEGACGV
jgi:hypothetical protein